MISIEVKEKHFLFLVGVLAMVSAVGIATGQTGPDPGHSPSEIGPGTFSGTSSDSWTFPGSVGVGGNIGVTNNAYVSGNVRANHVFPEGENGHPPAGSCVRYPVEIKTTTATHNGNFGGYPAIQTWIEANGCSGYHVCQAWEIAYGATFIRDDFCGGDPSSCTGWINTMTAAYTSGGDYECSGWTTSGSTTRGRRWAGWGPHPSPCSGAYPVLCCR